MKRLLLLICISIVSQIVAAQWHYSVSVTTSGCGYLDKTVAESQVKYWMGEGYKTFSNKNECEQSRMFVMSQSYTDGSCRVKYIASPCTGPVGTTGNANAFNSNNGSSFYSANPVNEILDWSNDYVERMLALNPEFYPKEQKTVATGDIAFDNLIERMPYSDEAFSGRMPTGSSYVITDGNISAIRKPAKGQGILVPDDFTSRPFNYGLGEWSSSDLNSIDIELASVGSSYVEESKSGFVSNAIRSLDEHLDWYNAINNGGGNTFQYLYTKFGKENFMTVSDWWSNNHIGERISNAKSSISHVVSEAIDHPFDSYDNLRSMAFDKVKNGLDEGLKASVQFMLPPQYQKTGERIQGIYDAEKGTVRDVFQMIKNAPDMIVEGKTIDSDAFLKKESDRYMGLAASTVEPATKVYAPLKSASDIYHMPKEQQGKGLAKWLGKELEKETKSEFKKSEQWKNINKKGRRLIDPYGVILD